MAAGNGDHRGEARSRLDFASWAGDLVGVDNPLTIAMPAPWAPWPRFEPPGSAGPDHRFTRGSPLSRAVTFLDERDGYDAIASRGAGEDLATLPGTATTLSRHMPAFRGL